MGTIASLIALRRIAPRVERTKAGDSVTELNRLLEPAARIRQVAQEPEGIEEVRFPTGIRTDNEHPLLQRDIDCEEVSPVPEGNVRKPHVRSLGKSTRLAADSAP
jgi:hypothetical protein